MTPRKVGEILTIVRDGKELQVRVTRVAQDGTYEGEIVPAAESSLPTAPSLPSPPSAARRFASSAWEQVNPMGLVNAVRHPLQTVQNIGQAQGREGVAAAEALKAGDYTTALRHGLGYLLPLIGPVLSQQGEKMAGGDIAGGLGGTIGLAANLTAPKAVPAMGRGVMRGAQAMVPSGAAAALERGSTARLSNVMAPKVGANKVRLGNEAASVAPQLAREPGLGGWTREGLAAKVSTQLQRAEGELDAAANARNAKLVYHTAPILRELRSRVQRLTAETVRQGRVAAGKDVVPSPNTTQVAVLERAIKEIEDLGPIASYESLRRMREAYDGPAKAVYSPAVTADYLLKKGEKVGAAKVTGVLRDKLATFDPQTAQANAQYSLYRAADDVLSAAEEVDRVRPTVGRRIMERAAGAIVGGSAAGLEGAAIGALVGPWIDSALSAGFTTQIQTARLMADLADALRAANASRTQSLVARLSRATGQAAPARAAVSAAQPLVPVPGLASDREPQ